MTTRIVGIVLVRNEEHFVTWAIGNAIDFCDEWLVIDNLSRDRTPQQLAGLAAAFPGRVRLIKEQNALRTNEYLQPYLGQDVWVFGLDGDEIYDRNGLARLRPRLLAGEFSRYWTVFGHSVHAWQVDLSAGTASGYVTPPAWPATKLYNFAALQSWHGNTQRLHGIPEFKPGWSRADRYSFDTEVPWGQCDFRNLHLGFFPRSSIDEKTEVRPNITDLSFRNVIRRPVFRALQSMGLAKGRLGEYLKPRIAFKKPLNYARGAMALRSLEGIGRPTDFSALDPAAGEAERLIAEVSARRINEAPPTS